MPQTGGVLMDRGLIPPLFLPLYDMYVRMIQNLHFRERVWFLSVIRALIDENCVSMAQFFPLLKHALIVFFCIPWACLVFLCLFLRLSFIHSSDRLAFLPFYFAFFIECMGAVKTEQKTIEQKDFNHYFCFK